MPIPGLIRMGFRGSRVRIPPSRLGNSTATTDFRLEFFANAVCDPSGNGEGETLLGSTMVTTDGSGNASFMVTFTATVAVGQFITATVERQTGPMEQASDWRASSPQANRMVLSRLHEVRHESRSGNEVDECVQTDCGHEVATTPEDGPEH